MFEYYLFQPQIRGIAMECIKTWAEQAGTKELFEGEMIADALKTGNPFLKADLLLWLAESLPEGLFFSPKF
jgi:cytoskeleton-associated protein 5